MSPLETVKWLRRQKDTTQPTLYIFNIFLPLLHQCKFSHLLQTFINLFIIDWLELAAILCDCINYEISIHITISQYCFRSIWQHYFDFLVSVFDSHCLFLSVQSQVKVKVKVKINWRLRKIHFFTVYFYYFYYCYLFFFIFFQKYFIGQFWYDQHTTLPSTQQNRQSKMRW